MIQGMHHVSMKCSNAEEYAAVRAFYTELLRIPVLTEWETGILLDTGAGIVEIFQDETAEKLGAAGTFLNKDEEEKKKGSDLFDRKSDICIDTIGSNQTITQCLDYIKETGTIAVYGLKSGENLNVPLPELRNFNIQYVQWPVPEVEAEVHKPVCDAIMDGKIDIDLFVTHRFSIDDYEKGFQAVKDRTALKVVLNF